MSYSADTFVADEQPTTAKWNKLWTNDASFNDGTGIADNAIINRHMADDSVTGDNLSLTVTESQLSSSFATSSTSFVDTALDVTLAAAGSYLILASLRGQTSAANDFGVAQLYNETTAAAISETETLIGFSPGGGVQENSVIAKVVTTTTTNNVLRVNLKSGGAWSISLLGDATAGKTRLLAIRIG